MTISNVLAEKACTVSLVASRSLPGCLVFSVGKQMLSFFLPGHCADFPPDFWLLMWCNDLTLLLQGNISCLTHSMMLWWVNKGDCHSSLHQHRLWAAASFHLLHCFVAHRGAFFSASLNKLWHLNTIYEPGGHNLSVKCDIVHLQLIMSGSPVPSVRYGCCGCCLTTSVLWSWRRRDKPGSFLFV